MPTIPQEYIITICAALIVWLVLKIANEAKAFAKSFEKNKPENYELMRIFETAWSAGEQLIEKHGYTDRAQIEAKVLKFANEYMLSVGFEPPVREMAEMLIKAVGRQYNEARKARGE